MHKLESPEALFRKDGLCVLNLYLQGGWGEKLRKAFIAMVSDGFECEKMNNSIYEIYVFLGGLTCFYRTVPKYTCTGVISKTLSDQHWHLLVVWSFTSLTQTLMSSSQENIFTVWSHLKPAKAHIFLVFVCTKISKHLNL